MNAKVTPLRIQLADGKSTSALLRQPQLPKACFVFAHGAGAGMGHAFMADLAAALADRDIATLRFQFPFMEEGSKRPDSPSVAHATVRVAVASALATLPGIPVFAGGKSFGGRMTSQAHAQEPLDGVRGLIFVGFPLHASGKPSVERARHLSDVTVPMLFIQGTRDALADLPLVKSVTTSLGKAAHTHVVDGADHSFHVLVRSGRTDSAVLDEVASTIDGWIDQVLSSGTDTADYQ